MELLNGDAAELRVFFQHLHESGNRPPDNQLTQCLNDVLNTLDHENPVIRPQDMKGRPGGLLNLIPGLTTILVPDLHTRTDFFLSLIDHEIEGVRILDRLAEGSVQVVCLGDGFHSESHGAAQRWQLAWEEYMGGYGQHQAIDDEMKRGLSLMSMVMTCKTAMPDHFHFLKGNHENVTNANDGGNRSFSKYVLEGQMVKDWFYTFLGPDILSQWDRFERSLPVFAVGERFLASHAEPLKVHSRNRIIEYRDDDELIFDLTWTGNDEAEKGSVQGMLQLHLKDKASGARYFGGHRPVQGRYALRAGNRYVQIHNPDAYVIAVLAGGHDPIPERDVCILG